jgi:hypothetical protein
MSLHKELGQKLSIYIPRVLGNIKQIQIKNTFHNLDIGNIFYIDMHNRVNENNNPYYFAFLSINLYNTEHAKEFYKQLLITGRTRVIYNESKQKYWEVKMHVEKEVRRSDIECIVVDYKKGLEEEYAVLEKEIFLTTIGV